MPQRAVRECSPGEPRARTSARPSAYGTRPGGPRQPGWAGFRFAEVAPKFWSALRTTREHSRLAQEGDRRLATRCYCLLEVIVRDLTCHGELSARTDFESDAFNRATPPHQPSSLLKEPAWYRTALPLQHLIRHAGPVVEALVFQEPVQ